MTRFIPIQYCWDCPHAIGSRRCRKSPYIDEHGCHLLREFDPDEFPRIPAWCPLEEAPAFVAHGPIQNNRKRNGVKMCKLSLVCPVCGWRQEVDLDDYLEIVQTPGHPYTCGNEECPVIHAEMVPEDEEIYEFKKRMDKLNREMAAVDEQLAAIHAETAPKLCSKCGRELTEVLEPSTRRTVLVCIPCLLNQKDQIITLKKDLEAPPGRRWGDMPVDLSSLIINEICGNCACSNADDPTGGDYCYRYQSTIGDLTPDQVIFCRHFEQQMEERGP